MKNFVLPPANLVL